jgi:predicted lipid-binding transport protein (Tim44 family)
VASAPNTLLAYLRVRLSHLLLLLTMAAVLGAVAGFGLVLGRTGAADMAAVVVGLVLSLVLVRHAVQPDDAASHRLASEDVVGPLRSSTSTVSLPREEAPQSAPAVKKTAEPDQPETSAPHAASDSDAPSQDTEPSEPTPVPSEATRAKSRKGRRASVPRWDEILFGAGQSDA